MADRQACLERLIESVRAPDEHARRQAQRAFDAKTKPRGSLGRLEELGCRIAAISGRIPDRLCPAVVVAAADHGVAAEAVSAYPQEVTVQMLANFVAGGAAINVLARQANAALVVVDAGVVPAFQHELVRSVRIGAAGTANLAEGPAMTREQTLRALLAGSELAAELAGEGINAVALGEMGIANTAAASALTAALLRLDPAEVCGRGTGLDDVGLAHKIEIVRRALTRTPVDPDDPLQALAAFGGFEIAYLVGAALGCAAARMVIVLDGFISGAAALVARDLAPLTVEAMIAGHRSPEPGHPFILDALKLTPLLELGLRLGEGSAAALALPLLSSSIALLNEMATFDHAQVTDAGR